MCACAREYDSLSLSLSLCVCVCVCVCPSFTLTCTLAQGPCLSAQARQRMQIVVPTASLSFFLASSLSNRRLEALARSIVCVPSTGVLSFTVTSLFAPS